MEDRALCKAIQLLPSSSVVNDITDKDCQLGSQIGIRLDVLLV
jgi:hypothetical protein